MNTIFHGMKMQMPEGWKNASTLVYVAPPSETFNLPTVTQQDPMAQGSLVVTPLHESEGLDVTKHLQAITESLKRDMKTLEVVERFEEQSDQKHVAGILCEQSDPLPLKQLFVIVKIGAQAIQVVGSAPKAQFSEFKTAFDTFLGSLELEKG